MRPSVVLLAATLLIGCKTVPEASIRDIDVPEGLNAAQVEFAILVALAEKPPPEDLRPSEKIADQALKAWFGPFYHSIQQPVGRWFLEAREDDSITAGILSGPHYVRVRMDYDSRSVRFQLEETRNLRRYRDRVHERAVQWIQDLEVSIRMALGRISMEG
jgi:hypothetical protein